MKDYLFVNTDSEQYFNWSTVAYDCIVTPVHSNSTCSWNGEKYNGETFTYIENEPVRFKAGEVVKLVKSECGVEGTLVLKIEKENVTPDTPEDQTYIAGSNVQRYCSTETRHSLWVTSPVETRIRVMMCTGWSLSIKEDDQSVCEGKTVWLPANIPFGFHASGIKNECFMLDMTQFRYDDEYLIENYDRFWSVNHNFNETIYVSHNKGWIFQFENENPFYLKDGMSFDVECGRKYRLVKSDMNEQFSNMSSLLKRRNIEIVDYEWGEKHFHAVFDFNK